MPYNMSFRLRVPADKSDRDRLAGTGHMMSFDGSQIHSYLVDDASLEDAMNRGVKQIRDLGFPIVGASIIQEQPYEPNKER